MAQFNWSLHDLKRELGPSLGIRSHSYLIELPIPGVKAKKLAILARSTSLPERNIGVVETFYKGRRYKMRGETDLSNEYTINVIDDSNMNLRQLFLHWMRQIDNTTPLSNNALGIFGDTINDFINTAAGVVQFLNTAKTAFLFDSGAGFLSNVLTGNPGAPSYQSEVNVWQLSYDKHKIFGSRLQNVFVSNVGTVEVNDEEENQLTQFSVTFAYSDFENIKDEGFMKKLIDVAIGPAGQDLINGVENLFD